MDWAEGLVRFVGQLLILHEAAGSFYFQFLSKGQMGVTGVVDWRRGPVSRLV